MTASELKPGIPGIDRPFKQINPDFPPIRAVLELMNCQLVQKMASHENNTDCSEVAEKLFQSTQQGAIIYFTDNSSVWPGRVGAFNPTKILREINIPEKRAANIVRVQYSYHAVFTDGRYIYDPTLSNSAIVKSDYMKLIKKLNPGRIGSRYTADNERFSKGEFIR